MDKELPDLGPLYRSMAERVEKYSPIARELLRSLPDLEELKRRLQRVANGEEDFSIDFAEEVRQIQISLSEIVDILCYGEPPKETKFEEALDRAVDKVKEKHGDLKLCGETTRVLITVLGWETVNYKWNMSLNVPVELTEGELGESFDEAIEEARDGLTGHVWETEVIEHEECEVTHEVDRDPGDDT